MPIKLCDGGGRERNLIISLLNVQNAWKREKTSSIFTPRVQTWDPDKEPQMAISTQIFTDTKSQKHIKEKENIYFLPYHYPKWQDFAYFLL